MEITMEKMKFSGEKIATSNININLKGKSMSDRLAKVRAEVERLLELLPTNDGDNMFLNYAENSLVALGNYIDSLQQEPVSEDLEQAIDTYLATYWCGEKEKQNWPFLKKMAIYFAKWQKEQFEKNRLTACDRQTEEEAEIESDFVMSIIENEHRQPTFDDAIKYGMKLQEKKDQETIELAEDHAMLAGMVKGKEETIEKACNYLHEHREEVKTEDNGIAGWISDEFIENFRKNMEE